MKRRYIVTIAVLVIVAIALWFWFRRGAEDRRDPVVAGGAEVTLLPFSSLDPSRLPPGWTNRTFWTKPPMELSHVTKDGRAALRCATHGGGSILTRAVDIAVTQYPVLTWDWFVETPLSGRVDETTPAGDDHPVRLFLRFTDAKGGPHATEIIWSNAKFSPGDYKVIGTFQHLVADGLAANAGTWRAERVDLGALYRHLVQGEDESTGRSDARLTTIGLFCDSDDTGEATVAYTTDVVAHRAQ